MTNQAKLILHRVTVGAAVSAVAILLLGGGAFLYLKSNLPTIRTLADYRPPQATRVYSDDGQLVALIAHERRTVVPIESVPEHVVHAFLAAEDAGFYEHDGIDYMGILRAAIKNLRPGARTQGASTITQQTVKTLVVGPERSYMRKLREAILARELEQMLTKDGILHIYLNQIYFGCGTYGIAEAARYYFDKSVGELDLGEAALLAAIPKNPGRYNIRDDPAAAKERQRYVLDQMVADGWATREDADREIAEPVPAPAGGPPYLGKTPHYVEEVRRLLIDKYGEETVYEGGLTVYTGMDAGDQVAAQEAVRSGLEDLARRQGWAGARTRIEVDRLEPYLKALHTSFDAEMQKRAESGRGTRQKQIWDLSTVGNEALVDTEALTAKMQVVPLELGTRVTGLVHHVDSVENVAWVDLGGCMGKLTLQSMQWARRFSPTAATPAPRDPSDVLQKGDLVVVDVTDVPVRLAADTSKLVVELELVPEPRTEGALVSIDPHTRYVRALVGGYRQTMGGLLRAVQSRRQPGSAFKPLVYAAGLDSGAITPASICADTPITIRDPWTGKAWKPENYEDGRYDGNITYRTALMHSKNTCSVKLIERVGPEKVIALAHAMGIHSDLPSNLTLALGTGDVTPLELANSYATIASGGLYAEPIFIRKVVDAEGHVLEENRSEPQEVLRPEVAYVLSEMMRSVVENGTGRRALVLDRPLAGKTGTSNQSRNVWFGGFSAELVAMVWVGFDDNASLGRATGASGALPIWIRYMGRALEGVPRRDFPPPEGVAFAKIDPDTGQLSGGPDAVEEAFVAGTEPTETNEPLPSIFMQDDPNLQ